MLWRCDMTRHGMVCYYIVGYITTWCDVMWYDAIVAGTAILAAVIMLLIIVTHILIELYWHLQRQRSVHRPKVHPHDPKTNPICASFSLAVVWALTRQAESFLNPRRVKSFHAKRMPLWSAAQLRQSRKGKKYGSVPAWFQHNEAIPKGRRRCKLRALLPFFRWQQLKNDHSLRRLVFGLLRH